MLVLHSVQHELRPYDTEFIEHEFVPAVWAVEAKVEIRVWVFEGVAGFALVFVLRFFLQAGGYSEFELCSVQLWHQVGEGSGGLR
jgi:hypothetical protein